MSSPASTPVLPDARSHTLDTIRGLAVLGILVMNISYFAGPAEAGSYPNAYAGLSQWDRWCWYLQAMFFEGRMRGLFSMLFGVGLYLQWRKAEREGYEGRFGDLWARRCVWLCLFGMAHGYLMQWPGDILFTYAICGLFLFPFRKMKVWGLLLLSLLMIGVTTGLGVLDSLEMKGRVRAYQEARDLKAEGEELSEKQQKALDGYLEQEKKRSVEAFEKEAQKRREADWLQTFGMVKGWVAKFESSILYGFLFWDAFGFMLLGLALAHSGFFTGRSPPWVYGLCMLLGYGLAAPWALHLAKGWKETGFSMEAVEFSLPQRSTLQLQRLLVGLAHASLLALLLRSAGAARLLAPLTAVGRMAFTNYIAQTAICTAVFYGWGLGWFGTLDRWQWMVFCLGVWAVLLLGSWLWLKVFRFGPLEWLWRSLVHLRWNPGAVAERNSGGGRAP